MSKMENIAQVSLIAVSLLAGVLLLEKRLSAPHAARAQGEDELVGNRLDKAATANWEESPTNVVLFISTQCHYCQESVPFYKRLTGIIHRRPGIAFRVLSAEPPVNVAKYLDQQQIAVTRVYQIPLPNPLLRATPTLVITDSHGVIKRAFIGKLDQAREKQILEALHVEGL